MKQISTILAIVFLTILVACTQETKLPNDRVVTAVSTSRPTAESILPTAAPTKTRSDPGSTLAAPTPSPTPTSIPTPQASASNQSNGRSNAPIISNDGQIIAFTSTGNLTGNAPGQKESLFVRDRAAKTTELINVTLDGQAGEWPIYGLALSGNGRVVAYYSHDGNLVAEDEMDCGAETQPVSCEDLFIFDRETGMTERLPLGRGDGMGKDYTLAISANGRFVAYSFHIYDRMIGQMTDIPTIDGERPAGAVFAPRFADDNILAFVSGAANLVPGDRNETNDVFVWNRAMNMVTRVSVSTDGSEGNESSGAFLFHEGIGSDMAISSDGRFVAFASLATNLTPDPINECDDYREFTRACYNLFLHDRETGETRLITRAANQDSNSPGLSADGRFLVFASLATTLTDDSLPECQYPAMISCGQIYLYDWQTDQIKLVSRNADGQAANQGSWQPDISGNGRTITFASSADNLVPGDTNNASDIFVFEQETNQVKRVSLVQTAVPTNPITVQTDAPLLFIRDNDLWRADLNGQNEQRLTADEMLADWFALNEGGDFWWAGGFPPQIHVSPDGRWLAFTQTGRNLLLVDVTGQEPLRVHELDGWAMIFTWAPDSQRLTYAVQPHFQLTSSQTGIFLYDVAIDSFRRLLPQNGGNLVWSLDGRFLAFSCCFSETQPGPHEGTYLGEVRQVELATQQVTTVGITWIGIASDPPPICWSATGAVGIDVTDPLLCSYERPYPFATAPDGEKTAVLSARAPDDDALFRLLFVKDQATDAILWQQEIPQVQTINWSSDGQWLLLGNSHYHYHVDDAAVWRIPADGSDPAQLLLPAALLLDVIPQW